MDTNCILTRYYDTRRLNSRKMQYNFKSVLSTRALETNWICSAWKVAFCPWKTQLWAKSDGIHLLNYYYKRKKKSRCYPFFWIITLHNKHSEVAKILAYIICQLHCYQNRNDLAISLSRSSHITMQLTNEKNQIIVCLLWMAFQMTSLTTSQQQCDKTINLSFTKREL